ncbi:AAA family ATPase [Demequina sp. SYSU T00039]|uniref:AAA family ATPase n=1 Tax=Demequina lignilytica TaxID=3051663 RepID=A0AAW7M8S3_9MICO|nr:MULTISPECIES: AAA family ATPase [unclassified Demequina]MDN4478650.1 AAA family ATPase [Demequina sp. SYSU T00039-1]MDN4488628.1 AAA family ATPase [Demequina sp. SYSU T00039]
MRDDVQAQDSTNGTDAQRSNAPAPHARAIIDALAVENVKAFAGRHEVPLAPLTLIFGPNAAGKSTLIQSLRLFARAVASGRRDALGVFEACFLGEQSPIDTLTSGHDEDLALSVGVHLPGTSRHLGLGANLQFFRHPIADLIEWNSQIIEDQGSTAVKHFRIDPEPTNHGEPEAHYWVAVGDGDLKRVRADPDLFAGDDAHADRLYDLAKHAVFLGPHRGDPQARYESTGDFFRASIDSKHVGGPDQFNAMLARLEMPYQFQARERFTPEGRVRNIWQLVDTRTSVDVDLNQVGYGVGQLLPVIQACVQASEQIICIEQPELHLHPRLQSKTGALLAHAVRNRNQVIVETHSENLLLRIRRLVQRGLLQPDEVAVIYVDNDATSGAFADRLELGTDGRLLDPWPTGFFDDSLHDILGISQ